MDNGRIMKELKELQEAAKNVKYLIGSNNEPIGPSIDSHSSGGRRQLKTLDRNIIWTSKNSLWS